MTNDLAAVERQSRLRILEAAWMSLSAKEEYWRVVQAGAQFSEDEGVRTLACLARYFTDRGRGVLTLGDLGFDWEAEIILRTIYECSVKMLLLSLVSATERVNLVEEFWELVPEVSDRKTARKATVAEEVFPHDHPSRDVFQLLYDHRMVGNSRKFNKRERREIERRWSFAEIVERLAQMKIGDKKVQGIRALLHMYGMASHLAHADHAAMDLMFDRALRPLDELVVLRIGHCARIATDLSGLGFFCAHVAEPHVGIPRRFLSDIHNAHAKLVEICSEYDAQFHESQQSFYDQMFGRDGITQPPTS